MYRQYLTTKNYIMEVKTILLAIILSYFAAHIIKNSLKGKISFGLIYLACLSLYFSLATVANILDVIS